MERKAPEAHGDDFGEQEDGMLSEQESDSLVDHERELHGALGVDLEEQRANELVEREAPEAHGDDFG